MKTVGLLALLLATSVYGQQKVPFQNGIPHIDDPFSQTNHLGA